MLAEKTNTAQHIIDAISPTAGKVSFISDSSLASALSYLENNGIPNNKHEDYKYCNVDAILKKDFKEIDQKFGEINSLDKYRLKGAITIAIVNGVFSENLSDKITTAGITLTAFNNAGNASGQIASLANPSSDPFIALNTAFAGQGFYLKIGKNTIVVQPIHILYITSTVNQALVNPRSFIELEEGASVTLFEQQISAGKGKTFSNILSEKHIHANARLNSVLLQDETEKGYSVNTCQVKIERNGNYDNTTVTFSGQLVRNNHNVVLNGEHCEAHLNGLFMTHNTQLVDNHTLMDHQKPNCQSNELYKGVINDKSTGVFNGKIFVRKDAQKTNAYQSSKNILLSDDGTINTKPQLEIYADDVKCSHGTSTGKIDEEAMFYLNARGISRETAQQILLNAFAGEVIEKITNNQLRDFVGQKLGFN